MTPFICVTCGTQHAASEAPPASCPVCLDERQYVGLGGQRWTTLAAMRGTHMNAWRMHEAGLLGIGTTPAFAIAQRALLILRPEGNILWDCITLLDEATEALVRGLGGVSAVAISHPHYYSSMVEWAHAFECPVWLHAGDRAHVMRPDPALRFWDGATHPLADGITLVNAPGHFDGGTMLHWRDGADGKGALLTGDIIQLLPDRAKVSFMRSYPNLIPLPARTVTAIEAAVAPFAFDRLYGAWWERVMPTGGKAAIAASAERYRHWIAG
jgi:hypothetical protein